MVWKNTTLVKGNPAAGILSTACAVAMWKAGPAWYSLAIIAIAMPCAWAGGRIRERQLGVSEKIN